MDADNVYVRPILYRTSDSTPHHTCCNNVTRDRIPYDRAYSFTFLSLNLLQMSAILHAWRILDWNIQLGTNP
ncbi:hypothetical protein KA005_16580, partial [bacterium]|nr:hypothetical protein [bacterium]